MVVVVCLLCGSMCRTGPGDSSKSSLSTAPEGLRQNKSGRPRNRGCCLEWSGCGSSRRPWHGWDCGASRRPCWGWCKKTSGHCDQSFRSRQDNWRTGHRSGGPSSKSSQPQRWTSSRCYCLAGRHSSPQQGGGVEAWARGQIGDCMKVSTAVTGTRAGTAAQALKMWRHRPRWAREEPT